MEREHQKVKSIIEVAIHHFLIGSSRRVNDSRAVEDYVVDSLQRTFGFTKKTASAFFRPCYWHLCRDKEAPLYELVTCPEGVRGAGLPVRTDYDLKMNGAVGDTKKTVNDILDRYGKTLLGRLRTAEYRGA